MLFIQAICRSFCESDITSVNEIISEVLWSIDLLSELGYPQQSVEIFPDNESHIKCRRRNVITLHSGLSILKSVFYTQECKKGTLFSPTAISKRC
jgi:hypothetical protein